MGNIQWGETKVTIERVEDPLNIVLEHLHKADIEREAEEYNMGELGRLMGQQLGGYRLRIAEEFNMFLEKEKKNIENQVKHLEDAQKDLEKIGISNDRAKKLEKKITEDLSSAKSALENPRRWEKWIDD